MSEMDKLAADGVGFLLLQGLVGATGVGREGKVRVLCVG